MKATLRLVTGDTYEVEWFTHNTEIDQNITYTFILGSGASFMVHGSKIACVLIPKSDFKF